MATTQTQAELLRKLKQEANAYAIQRKKEAEAELQSYVADLKADYEKTVTLANRQYYAEKDAETPKRAAASVEAALLRRQARERLADRGLSGSGAERTAVSGAAQRQRLLEQESLARVEAMREKAQATMNAAYADMLKKQKKKQQELKEAVAKDILRKQEALQKAYFS